MTTPPPIEPAETLGQRIARMRAVRGWTQEQLAGRLAASRVAVSHFELGLALPSERTVVLLAGLFHIEPYELVAGTSYPSAKAERLPLVACRYTEVDLQLALLQRDLVWLARSDDMALCAQVRAEWRSTIAALLRSVDDLEERSMLEAAQAQLR